MASLPDDVIFEILTRMPLQTLGRSKLVSLRWNQMTYEPSFTDLHPSRSKTALGYFIQSQRYGIAPSYVSSTDGEPQLSISFLPRSVKIVACDHGILLCVKERGDKKPYVPEYYVCKPTTKEFTKIPNPKTKYLTERIAMVVSRVAPLHYKIIRVSDHRDSRVMHKMLRCEVFDSDTGEWKRLCNVKVPYDHIFGDQNPIVVGDEVVWFSVDSFLVFGTVKETWEIRPLLLPDADEASYSSMRITKHEGKLCMMRKTDDKEFVDIWTMENSRQGWKKKRVAVSGGPLIDLGFPLALKNAEVAVFGETSSSEIKLYNFSTCTTSKTVTAEGMDSATNAFLFCSDFEPCL